MYELKSTEDLPFMTLKSDAWFKEKLTCGFENHVRNSANCRQSLGRIQRFGKRRCSLSAILVDRRRKFQVSDGLKRPKWRQKLFLFDELLLSLFSNFVHFYILSKPHNEILSILQVLQTFWRLQGCKANTEVACLQVIAKIARAFAPLS